MGKTFRKAKKDRMGHALVEAGIITPKQLKFAISEQRKLKGENRERLGEILLKSGAIDEEYIKRLEWTNNIFPNVDYTVYCT